MGCSFHRAFEIKRYIKRYVKIPCKQVPLPIGAPMGEPGEDLLAGAFWIEKNSISGFLSWTQWTIRF
jgi:hypothetical protein